MLQLNWNTDDLRLADSLLTTLENYFRLFHSLLTGPTSAEQLQDVAGEIEVQEAHGLVSQMRTFFDHFEERVLLLRGTRGIFTTQIWKTTLFDSSKPD